MDIKCWLTLHGSEYLFAMDSTYVRYCVYNLCSEVLVELPVYDFPVLIVVKQNDTNKSSVELLVVFSAWLGIRRTIHTSSLGLLMYCLTVFVTCYERIYTDMISCVEP